LKVKFVLVDDISCNRVT